MLIKQKTTLEEDNIVLNICRLILNKNKNIDTFLT